MVVDAKSNLLGGVALKRGFGHFADLRGGAWQERGGWCFWDGVDTTMDTMGSKR